MKPENEAAYFKRTSHPLYDLRLLYGDSPGGEHLYRTVPVQPECQKQMSDTMQEENQILIDQLNRVCGCVAPRNHEAFGHHILRDRKKRGSEE